MSVDVRLPIRWAWLLLTALTGCVAAPAALERPGAGVGSQANPGVRIAASGAAQPQATLPPAQAPTLVAIAKTADIIGKVRGPVGLKAGGRAYRVSDVGPWAGIEGALVTLLDATGRPVAGFPPVSTDADGNYVFHHVPIGWKGTVNVKAGTATMLTFVEASDKPADVTPATTVTVAHLQAALAAHPGELAGLSATRFRAVVDAVEATIEKAAIPIDLSSAATAASAFDEVARHDEAIARDSAAAVSGAEAPHPLAVAVDASGQLWVVNTAAGTVERRDAAGAVLGSYPVGLEPQALVFDARGHLWVSDRGSNSVTELDGNGNLLGTFGVGRSPRSLAVDGQGTLWVANEDDNTESRLDPQGAASATVAGGAVPRGLAAEPAGGVWVANAGDNTVSKVDAAGTLSGTYAVSDAPTWLAADGHGGAWVVYRDGSRVSKLASTGEVLGDFPVGKQPEGLSVDAAGRVWVANYADHTLSVLAANGTLLKTLAVGPAPFAVLIVKGQASFVAGYATAGIVLTPIDPASIPAQPAAVSASSSPIPAESPANGNQAGAPGAGAAKP